MILRYLFNDCGRSGAQSAFLQVFRSVENGPYSKYGFSITYSEESVKEHRKVA